MERLQKREAPHYILLSRNNSKCFWKSEYSICIFLRSCFSRKKIMDCIHSMFIQKPALRTVREFSSVSHFKHLNTGHNFFDLFFLQLENVFFLSYLLRLCFKSHQFDFDHPVLIQTAFRWTCQKTGWAVLFIEHKIAWFVSRKLKDFNCDFFNFYCEDHW